jgi:GNAT superfamily N-acetyltransferase
MSLVIRRAEDRDVAGMASIRAQVWQSEEFWKDRIGRYLKGEHSPQQALTARAAFVVAEDARVVGFVAGHLTRRFGCDGELQWINVVEERRGTGIAGRLMGAIAAWFAQEGAVRICVNVDTENAAARKLYAHYGARPLNEGWMVWEDGREMAARSSDGKLGDGQVSSS